MSAESELESPIPPASAAAHGQRAETAEDRKALIATPSISGEYLEGGLSSTLAGLSTSNSKAFLNQIGAASVLTVLDHQARRIDELSRDSNAQRQTVDELRVALSDMRSRADIAETRASDAEGTKIGRDVTLTLGGVLLGIAGGGFDKLGLALTIVFGAIALLLIGSVIKPNSTRTSK